MKIVKGADNIIRYVGPVNGADNTSINVDDYPNATCDFRVFDERKEHTVGTAKTRLRSAIAEDLVGGIFTGFEIPYFSRQIFEAGDVVSITDSRGVTESRGIMNYSRGTEPSTPGTNFDSFDFVAGLGYTGYAFDEGAEVILDQMGAAHVLGYVPVNVKDKFLDDTDTLRIFLSGGTEDRDGVDIGTTYAHITEDGETASNQDPIYYLQFTNPGAIIRPGDIIRREFSLVAGDPVDMPIYPATPGPYIVGNDNWGYAGVLADTETVAFEAGQKLRFEITFDGSGAGSGLRDKKTIFATVVEL